MRRIFQATGLVCIAVNALASDVGVSVSLGQPGFYGQLVIGDYPSPVVVNRQPILIERGAHGGAPIYLRVPPGHQKHWNKHCREYDACGRPVHFVDDRWYSDVYAPRYRDRHHGSGDRNGRYEDPYRDRGPDQRHGKGHGRD